MQLGVIERRPLQPKALDISGANPAIKYPVMGDPQTAVEMESSKVVPTGWQPGQS
ncbi:hypothetical protein CRG98_024291 [Punica granatum]|uniref:Uncharacterized protein n=1 Tax=Punica granatum TaxID=22663 RepID=A0A2I0JG75_PUNGR|nr:hypothetical protein CRG98_024291 [Punica granatum]